ncbi:MAG: TonB-dependent receptor [Bacteroidota bacterium]|nr:TonB-dependent receptor [Bacteroidota bacterium]
MKIIRQSNECSLHSFKKIWLIMKLNFFLILLTVLQVSASVSAQNTRLDLKMKNATISQVFDEIERQSEVYFFYNKSQIDENKTISVDFRNKTIDDILKSMLSELSLTYEFAGKNIIVKPSEQQNNGMQQQKSVSGKVTDSSGASLPGVSVVVKGTTNGTITDTNGNYSLSNIPENATLQFSFVGMKSKEIVVGNQAVINIVLEDETIGVDEVVVVGYGTQKKVNLTGAITSLDGEALSRRQVAQSSMVLQGVAPGVVVTQRSGQPGRDGGTISIRGKTTLGDSNPLILVDGIEMGLNNIDPSMIESISVLKDAASSSIYGSRAANGVILVTTKRAEFGKMSVSYNSYVGYQSPTNLPDMVGAIDHMTLTNEAYVNSGKSPLYSDAYIQEYRENMASNPDKYPDTDWYDKVLTKNGFMQSHFLTMMGGTEKAKIAVSMGYLDQDGIMENTSYKRYTIRLNTDLQLTKTFSTQIDAHIMQSKLTEPSRGTSEAIHWSGRIPANQTGVLTTGQWGEGWNGDNPIAFSQDGGIRYDEAPSVTMNIILKYQPVKWLYADFAYSPNYWQSSSSSFIKAIQTYRWDGSASYLAPQKSTLSASNNRNLTNNIRSTVTFDKAFGEHGVKVLFGFQQEDYRNDGLTGYRESFAFPNYPVLNSGGELNQKSYGWASEWALQSFFGRLNYSYLDKYLFEGNFRYDGSSRFVQGRKWGVFPSFSAGWRISEEPFFANLKDKINNLKLRASWGKLGNQNIGSYPFSSDVNLGLKYVFDKQVLSGAGITDLANTEISWETTTSSNIGVDVTLLDKLNITADYYYKKTDDILLPLDIPKIIGMNAPAQNAGVVENKGWDLGINYSDWEHEFKYEIGINISDVKNKVLDLRGVNKTGITVNHEGQPMYSLYGLKADGFITKADFDETGKYKNAKQFGSIAPGDIKYVDMNNDSIINSNDYTIIGHTIPRYTFGFTFNSKYKNFDFSFFLQGVGKADGLIRDQGIMPFVMGGTVQEQHKDRWTPDNRDAMFPRFAFNETNNEQTSSFWMRDASYVRLKNIQLGYTLPKRIMNKIKAQQLRIYFSGQNLLTLDNFWDGYDVEAPVGNGGYYPQVKTYSFGLDVKF